MSATMECNPQTFYINKTSKSEIFGTMQNIQSLVSSSTLIFLFTFLPFLIITPFWVEKLRTANRKIIAMISLSDCLNLILALIMGARRSDYSDAAGGYLLFECTFITMLQNIAPTWSILWSFTLLATVWFGLMGKVKYNQASTFTIANFVVWPTGVFIALLPILSYLYHFDMRYNGNYLAAEGCQPNFKFHITEDGKNCVVDEIGKNSLVAFYSLVFTIVIATDIMFILIFWQAFKVWRQFQAQVQSTAAVTVGYIVAAKYSKEILKSSVKFSITGFIYIVAWLPLFIRQFIAIYIGPGYDYRSLVITQALYMLTIGNFVPMMNVLFYGFCSNVFRTEMYRIVKQSLKKFNRLLSRYQQTFVSFKDSNRYGMHNKLETSLATTDYETDSDCL